MIRNRSALAASSNHAVALDCIEAAVESAAPENATLSSVDVNDHALSVEDTDYDLDEYERIVVVGGGKAATGVTKALVSVLADRITEGVIVVKQPEDLGPVRAVAGDHPLPTERNERATTDILDLADRATEDTLVIAVVTGGASSLLTAPAEGLSYRGLRETTRQLLEAGATIDEINTVRRHLSEIKGGTLARRAAPATVVSLVFSDVVGNDLSTIASGPTVPDDTTYADAITVCERYDLDPNESVSAHLDAGARGERSETPAQGARCFESVDTHLVGDNRVALDAARDIATKHGYRPVVLTSSIRGEASEIGKSVLAIAEEVAENGRPVEPPAALLVGGETTVTVSGDGGQGGPNQELVLSVALEEAENVVIAAVDSDGNDGSTNSAGAIADDTTVTDVDRAKKCLDENNAGAYLTEVGSTIETGLTGTNVNDVIVLTIEGSGS